MTKIKKIDIPYGIIIRILLLAVIVYVITIPFQIVRLSESVKESNQYKGNEILIFKSNKSEVDSIILNKVSTDYYPPDMGEMFWSRNVEILRVYTEIDNFGNYFISYEPNSHSSEINVYFDIVLSGNRYSHSTTFNELDKLKKHKVIIAGNEYYDVKFIDRTYRKSNKQHIDRIYWSNSNGIVRIDVDKNYYWELLNKK